MNTEAVNQEYQTVNLSQLTESLTNPRKTFDHKTLNEMAESIRAVGLLQPILVRPTATEGSFEIVAGARRFRAARLAEIESVCVRVCQLTDAQTLEAQLIENLVRADVHPYEETQGFLALMRLDPARYTAQELAAKTGKSVTFVLQRLKLADLIPAAAKSFQKDEIATGHALLLARLSTPQQVEAFPHCFADVWLEGKQKKRLVNVAEFSHYIDSNIILELSEAPFSREDDTLYPAAGACLNCPKRSGFNTLLFPDVKKDSCFDPACYGEKVTRFIAASNLVQLAGDYRAVPQGSATVPRSKYTVLKSGDRCSYATQGIVAIGHNAGAILTVCTSIECEKHSTVKPRPMPAAFGANPDAEDEPEPNATQGFEQDRRSDQQPPRDFRRIEQKVKEETAAQLRKEFGEKIFTVPSADSMGLLAFMVAYAVEDYAEDFLTLWKVAPQDEESNVETFEQLLAHLAGLSGKEQTTAIFDMLLFSAGGCDAYNYRVSPSVAKAAQLYGVNVEEVETRVRRGIMDQEAQQIPQDQRSESDDSEAAAEPENDATPLPEDQLDESEMPELQEAEEATATADEAEEEPAEAEEVQQQEEEASTEAEGEEQPTVNAEAAQGDEEEPVEAEEAQQQEEEASTVAEAEEQPTVNAEAAQGDEEEPVEAEEAQQQEEEASTVAEAEEQPTVNAEAAQNPGEEQAEAQGTTKPPKPRNRTRKGSGRTKRAAITPPAKAAKKRTAKG
jgi:ParB family chromosome partitioning protein